MFKSLAELINMFKSLAELINMFKSLAEPINMFKSLAEPINMFKSLAEPIRTKYKLERGLNRNLEMFPKLCNAIKIDLKETKSAKIFKQRVINIYLDHAVLLSKNMKY